MCVAGSVSTWRDRNSSRCFIWWRCLGVSGSGRVSLLLLLLLAAAADEVDVVEVVVVAAAVVVLLLIVLVVLEVAVVAAEAPPPPLLLLLLLSVAPASALGLGVVEPLLLLLVQVVLEAVLT